MDRPARLTSKITEDKAPLFEELLYMNFLWKTARLRAALLCSCCYEPSARIYLLANHCSGKICRRPTDSFLPISFKYKICCGPTDIFLPISFGCKYAVALQYLLSPIRFKAETAVALQEQIFVFPPIRLVVKICLRSLQRRSPTHLLYEKAICKNVQKLKQANS